MNVSMIMNNREIFANVESPREQICNCPIHRGDVLVQYDATLINGKPVRVLFDKFGTHAEVGKISDYAPLVSPQEFERMIREALQ